MVGVAETDAEHLRALVGVVVRLTEACTTDTCEIADLEARAERAVEE